MVSVAGSRDSLALSVGLRRKRPIILLRPSGERPMGERRLGAGLHSQTVGHIKAVCGSVSRGITIHLSMKGREEDVLSMLMRLRRSHLFVLLV